MTDSEEDSGDPIVSFHVQYTAQQRRLHNNSISSFQTHNVIILFHLLYEAKVQHYTIHISHWSLMSHTWLAELS